VNLLSDNIDTIKKNTQTLIDTSKKVGLKVDTPECRAKSRHKDSQKCFENAAQFRYLGTTIRYRNLIQEEIKRILNSGNGLLPFSPESFIFSSVV
jgi:hypothetical protein